MNKRQRNKRLKKLGYVWVKQCGNIDDGVIIVPSSIPESGRWRLQENYTEGITCIYIGQLAETKEELEKLYPKKDV